MTEGLVTTRVIISATAVLLASACGPASEPEHAAPDAAPPIAVSVERVAAMDRTTYVEAGGIVRAAATALVGSRIVAPVEEVLVRPGDRVTRGQRLVTLDGRELNANAERANAAAAAAIETSQATESRAAAAGAELRLAESTHARIKALYDKKSATPQELDRAAAALDTARAQVQAARAESAAAAAARNASRAAAAAAVAAGSYAAINAPFDGIVAARMADPGSLASPGVPLLVIESGDRLRLEVRLDESRAAGIAVGQRVSVRLDASGEAAWTDAAVVEIGRADPESHSVLVKIELPAGVAARTGAFGRARFAAATRPTLTIGDASVVRRAGLTFVFVVDAGQRARLRPIVLGAVDGDRAEVLAGAAAGEMVVVNPPPGMADGSLVQASVPPGAGGAAQGKPR